MTKKILFVCTGNTCRSPLAKVFTEEQLALACENGWTVDSAGLVAQAGLPASREAAVVAGEAGLDLSTHSAKQVTLELAAAADIVLVMTHSHKKIILNQVPQLAGKVFTAKEFVGDAGDVSDPFGGSVACYRGTARELAGLGYRIVEKLRRSRAGF